MSQPRDPLAAIVAQGIRVVWMEDFDYQTVFVDGYDIALIDHRIRRIDAALSLMELLIESPAPWRDAQAS